MNDEDVVVFKVKVDVYVRLFLALLSLMLAGCFGVQGHPRYCENFFYVTVALAMSLIVSGIVHGTDL